MGTALITSPKFIDHFTGRGHPESPERIKAIHKKLSDSGLLDRLRIVEPKPRDRKILESVHQLSYISRFETASISGAHYLDTLDNSIGLDSYTIAVLSASAALEGVDQIMTGKTENAMVVSRPPGHHAEEHMAMGFCFFNNIAIAARYLKNKYDVNRLAIIDFDVHHGNGTQHTFDRDPTVLYTSLHRYPFFPGTGDRDETGSGPGIGTKFNYPLEVGTGDDVYLDILRNSIPDKVLKFQPEFILLSTGFDAHILDPIGGMRVTTEAFGEISRVLASLAGECCQGKVLSILEGGYHLDGLADSVQIHLEALLDA